MIRVLLVDDHSIVRDGLKRILAATTDLEVAGEAASGEAALALVKANDYDVAMLDMSMPGLSGIDLIKRLKLEKPKLRILVLSMHGEQQYAARALKAGASGYLNKDSASELLLGALRKIAAGGVHIGEAAAASLLQSGDKTCPRSPVRSRIRGAAPAGRRARPDRDRRAPAPLGEDRQHPQDAHPGEAQRPQHRRAGALRAREPAGLGIFLPLIAASDDRPGAAAARILGA